MSEPNPARQADYIIRTIEQQGQIPDVELKPFGDPVYSLEIRPLTFTVQTPEWFKDYLDELERRYAAKG